MHNLDPVARRRTFAIISHPDAGKTTLTEKLLLFGGAIQLAGEVRAKANRRQTRSDWMGIERERGISVVTSVMTFEYGDCVYNLLDTPGHEDFSEDTYRTLTAVDSAIMVIDAAKGIEARTRKLFEVCRLRDIPIITFINKMDRETRDPFDLLDEIEKTLALDTVALTWPIGRGRGFAGTYDLRANIVRRLEEDAEPIEVSGPDDPKIAGNFVRRADALVAAEEIELAREAQKPFDVAAFLEGHLTPVFFGSALKKFGVQDLIDALAEFAPPPQPVAASTRKVDPRESQDERLRVQDSGEHGPQPPRPHRLHARHLGQADARHEGAAVAHGQEHRAQRAAILLRPGPATGRGGLRRRRRRHSQPRRLAHRRHADRRRKPGVSRRAEFRAGNSAPRQTRRRHEGQEIARGLAADGRGGRGAAVPAA